MDQKLTRDQARQAFSLSRLTMDYIDRDTLQDLKNRIDKRMKESGCIRGSLRCVPVVSMFKYGCPSIRCKAFYFPNREAVTFNPDGFVGFAGWADEENIQPILHGFMDWLRDIASAS